MGSPVDIGGSRPAGWRAFRRQRLGRRSGGQLLRECPSIGRCCKAINSFVAGTARFFTSEVEMWPGLRSGHQGGGHELYALYRHYETDVSLAQGIRPLEDLDILMGRRHHQILIRGYTHANQRAALHRVAHFCGEYRHRTRTGELSRSNHSPRSHVRLGRCLFYNRPVPPRFSAQTKRKTRLKVIVG